MKEELTTKPKNPRDKTLRRLQFEAGHCWFYPPDPVITLFQNAVAHPTNTEIIRPDAFYYPRVFVFDPSMHFPNYHLPCKTCPPTEARVSVKGWAEDFRRVIDSEDSLFILSRRLHCKKCNQHYTALSDEILSKYPIEIQLLLPFTFSKRSGLSTFISKSLNSYIDAGIGPSAIARKIQEDHTRKYDQKQVQYYATVNSIIKHIKATIHASSIVERLKNPDDNFPKFSTFHDRTGYAGYVPSSIIMLNMLVIFFRQLYIGNVSKKCIVADYILQLAGPKTRLGVPLWRP